MRTDFTSEQLTDAATANAEAVIRNCVHCGFCTATCPTYVLLGDELDSPRGRIYLIQEMLEKEAVPTANVVKHIDRCLSCLSCMTTCPSGVNYMHLIDHARAYIELNYRRPLQERLFRAVLAWVLPHPGRFRAALALARVARPAKRLVEHVGWLKPVAAMLALAPRKVPWPTAHQPSPPAQPIGRVALLQGCAESVLRPEIRAAAVRVLNRSGYEVIFVRGEKCCGALVHHMGREAAALEAARHNIDAWCREIDGEGLDAILITASGCGLTIKNYGFMLREDPVYAARAQQVSALAKDISEFLEESDLPKGDKVGIKQAGIKVAYHAACSLQHGQKVSDAPSQLLTRLGYQVRTPIEAHLCCGSAGTYNILQAGIASQLGDRKVANLARLSADVIATGNIGCAMQISARSSTPVVHTVELIDWATGGPTLLNLRTTAQEREKPRARDGSQYSLA